MHVISKRHLREFWEQNPESEQPLRSWYSICDKTPFRHFADLKRAFRSADKVGKFTVFDIGGNKWRIIAVVHYTTGKIYVRAVLTHKQYDQDFWKRE